MSSSSLRIRDLGYSPGELPTGPSNSILDVPGVHIAQTTVPTSFELKSGVTASKGVTVISPRPPKEFYKPCRAATFCLNGNGEVTGSRQISDWGYTNTPIALTNSLSLGTVFDGMWDWIIEMGDHLGWDDMMSGRHYGTPVVGETCDWGINSDFRQTRLSKEDIKACFARLKCREDGGVVQEGQSGGGASMTCHHFTGGTGTSSRLLGSGVEGAKTYTLAALCQSNYGLLKHLSIGGVPIGKMLQREGVGATARFQSSSGASKPMEQAKDGSIVIVVITDAPLTTNQLSRIARHVTAGLAMVGGHGIGRNSSGDIFVALSTAEHGPEQLEDWSLKERGVETYTFDAVKNECIDPFFYACAEAVEEAILNSMMGAADGVVGMNGTKWQGLPVDRVAELLKQHRTW